MTPEEARKEALRDKARNLRYKKPLVAELNMENIRWQIREWEEQCSAVQWAIDKDGYDNLAEILGDDDDAREFQMQFSALESDLEKFDSDLEESVWDTDKNIDCFLVACGAGDGNGIGGYIGYDTYEEDYYPIGYAGEYAVEEQKEAIKRLTKDRLLELAHLAVGIVIRYEALKYRFDSMNSALEILKDTYGEQIQASKRVNELYEKIMNVDFQYSKEAYEANKAWGSVLSAFPGDIWIM